MTKSRQCPFDGCQLMVLPTQFACAKHWYSLSREQQAKLYMCYDDWNDGTIDGDELRRIQQTVLDEAQGKTP